MSQVRIPTEPAEPMQQPDPGSPKKSRAVAMLAACAIMTIPVGYLIQYYGFPAHASAGSLPVTVPAQDIASQEQSVRLSPTVGNRINLSLAYIKANQPGRAVPVLNSVVADDSRNALAWNNLCVARTMQMEYNSAIEDCKTALRIIPGFQLAQNNLKWAEDENTKALAALAEQERVAPATRDANSYLAEGLNFLHSGGYDQAIKAWQRTLDLDPRSALAANNIGTAFMYKKQPDIAISWFKKAIALDPALQIAKNNLAWALDEQNRDEHNRLEK
jgi:superkiller protein 3